MSFLNPIPWLGQIAIGVYAALALVAFWAFWKAPMVEGEDF